MSTLIAKKIQVNILFFFGGEITNIGYPDFSPSATAKSYVDSRAPAWLTHIGSTQVSIKLSGFDNEMGSKRILNVAKPTARTDAATKACVDNRVSTIASLTSIVDKLSTAPASGNVNFWISLRRKKSGSGTTLTFLYYIPTAYIDGETGGGACTSYPASNTIYRCSNTRR